jgi:DNA-binding transcriptional LysR family regulator
MELELKPLLNLLAIARNGSFSRRRQPQRLAAGAIEQHHRLGQRDRDGVQRSAYHHQLEALFVVAGLRWPLDCIATNSMAAMKALVIHGDCVAIMPRQLVALERRAGLIRCIRLAEAGGTRALGLSRAKERKLSPIAERFAEIIRASAREQPFRQFAASG